ncbi:MAG: CrcB family protein [Deltaproteobacteria bacterium]
MSAATLLALAIGGGIAAILRLFLTRQPSAFPWSTLLVNTAGAFALGVIITALEPTEHWRSLLVTGFCGTLTTLSSFAWQTVVLGRAGRVLAALTYMAMTILLPLLSVWAGTLFGRAL